MSSDFSSRSTLQLRHTEAGFLRSHGIWWGLGPLPQIQFGRLQEGKGKLIGLWNLWAPSSMLSSEKIKLGVFEQELPKLDWLTDKPHTTWTLTLPMTHLWLPIIQGIFVKSPTNTCSWAWLSLFVYSRITIAYINIEFLIWLNMESKFMFLTKGVLCQKYVLKL